MKLEIWRDQSDVKGLFGGHKGVSFKLITRVQVSDAEKALIEKYKVGDDTLVAYELPGRREMLNFTISINQMLAGYTVNTMDVATLMDVEEAVKRKCRDLKGWLGVMATFGGYEAVEI